MGAAIEELERGAGVVYARCEGIWVMLLFAEPIDADMARARPALRAMTNRHRDGFSTLTWVLPQAGLVMENDARKTAAEVTKEFEGAILAQATLIEGTGFQAATVRAIIAGLDVMSRSSSAKKVFAELPPAVAWCMARRPAGGGGSEAEITAALLQLRGSIQEGR